MKEKNQIIAFIVVIVFLFIGLYLLGRPGKNQGSAISDNSISEGSQELGNSHSAISENALRAEEKFYDFGTISMKNGLVSKKFKIANSIDEDIKLPSLTTSCMCTSAYFIGSDGEKSGSFGMPGMGNVAKLNKTIKAGDSAYIEVVYDPNAHGPAGVGSIDRFVYLEDEGGNKLQFEIKANVTP